MRDAKGLIRPSTQVYRSDFIKYYTGSSGLSVLIIPPLRFSLRLFPDHVSPLVPCQPARHGAKSCLLLSPWGVITFNRGLTPPQEQVS